MSCEVCGGGGRYMIMTERGQHWGTIECPACYGTGLDDEKADTEYTAMMEARADEYRAEKYHAAMVEMRAATPPSKDAS